MRISFYLLLVLALTIAGCGAGGSSVDVSTPIAVYTAAPTDQPTVPPTQAPATPTAEATATPIPTEAPAATATSEPSPTPTTGPTVEPTVAATTTPTSEATATPIPTETETPTATATSVPPTATPEAEAEIDPIYAGLPEEILALMPTADAAQGEALTVSNACIACHSLQKDVRVVGPSWYRVGGTAGERVPGQSAGLYLYTSVVDPNAYINEGYLAGLMPQTYSAVLSSEQIADIVAYLLTLHGE